MKFQRTTAVNKILQILVRIKIIQGGTSAGKTVAILAVLIDRAIKTPDLEISVVGFTYPHLRRGALKDFKKLMKATGRWNGDHWLGGTSTYTFPNGSYIEFFSVDDEFKVRGARRDILFINEANRIKFNAYHQLRARTSQDIYIDFNPTKRFWAHDEDETDANSELIKLTYLDNEARPRNVDDEMKRAKRLHDQGDSPYWVNFWKVFGLGEIGALQGAVWTDWSVIPSIPKDAVLSGFGCDFGYAISHTAVIAVWKWKENLGTKDKPEYVERYIFDEWIHETGLQPSDIAEMMKAGGYSYDMMYCDSSEPKTIDKLNSYGINAFPCASKTDIRPYAISQLSQDHFYITENSQMTISNISNYTWQEDKAGTLLNKPKKDDNDHGPDAIIYFIGTEDKYDGRY